MGILDLGLAPINPCCNLLPPNLQNMEVHFRSLPHTNLEGFPMVGVQTRAISLAKPLFWGFHRQRGRKMCNFQMEIDLPSKPTPKLSTIQSPAEQCKTTTLQPLKISIVRKTEWKCCNNRFSIRFWKQNTFENFSFPLIWVYRAYKGIFQHF